MKYKKLIDHKTLRQALLYYGRRCQNGIVQRLEENDEIRDAVKQIRKLYSCFKDAEAARMTLYQTIGVFSADTVGKSNLSMKHN